MLETNQSNKSILAFIAEYAQLSASEEELVACKALLDSIVNPMRVAPNNPLAALEPVTSFHVATHGVPCTASP